MRDTTAKSGELNRRDFIKKASAASGAFVLMKQSLVRGAEARSKVKVGIIGLGGRGSLIAKLAVENGGYEIAAIADYFEQTAQAAGAQFGIEKEKRFWGLNGYKKLIASGVDALICETPPCFFPDHVSEGVEAGCHIYMAKPVAADTWGTLKVRDAATKAKEKGLVFFVDFQKRTEPFIIETVKRLHNGDAGRLSQISVLCNTDGFRDPPREATIENRLKNLIWVNDIELGGGHIVNYDIHAVDVALWIAQANPVSAMGASRKAAGKDSGNSHRAYSVTYKFENGIIMNHLGEHMRNLHGGAINCMAFGDQGYGETNYDGKAWLRSNKRSYRGGEVENLYNEGIKRNLATFRKNVLEGDCENPTAERSINATLATILGREAAARNCILTWDELLKENQKLDVDITGLQLG